ncbi:MAG: transposase [Acidimicrobiia bacterium]
MPSAPIAKPSLAAPPSTLRPTTPTTASAFDPAPHFSTTPHPPPSSRSNAGRGWPLRSPGTDKRWGSPGASPLFTPGAPGPSRPSLHLPFLTITRLSRLLRRSINPRKLPTQITIPCWKPSALLRGIQHGLLTSEAVAEMSEWEHGGGFSLDASIRIGPNDRAGLERLLRYCARPAFSRERLCWSRNGEQVLYQLPKPRPDLPVPGRQTGGQTMLRLDPLEFLDRLASLVPPPRSHRHRYCGVLAPNARLRPMVTARAGLPVEITEAEQAAAASAEPAPTTAKTAAPASGSRCSSLWAAMLARIFPRYGLRPTRDARAYGQASQQLHRLSRVAP